MTLSAHGVNLGLHRQIARLLMGGEEEFGGYQWSAWQGFGEVALSTWIRHQGGQSDAKSS